MESKKCPGSTNLNQYSGLRAKFDSNLWDSGTFLTPCVRGLTDPCFVSARVEQRLRQTKIKTAIKIDN